MEKVRGYGVDGWRVQEGGGDLSEMSSGGLECRYVQFLPGLHTENE